MTFVIRSGSANHYVTTYGDKNEASEKPHQDIMHIGTKMKRQQVKIKLCLCLTKHHAMKTYGGMEV
jgi:hypothetical protein